MNKKQLKRRLSSLIDGELLGEELTILYKNPATGVTEVLYQSPGSQAPTD
jgi:negative regulator of sigma E activity